MRHILLFYSKVGKIEILKIGKFESKGIQQVIQK